MLDGSMSSKGGNVSSFNRHCRSYSISNFYSGGGGGGGGILTKPPLPSLPPPPSFSSGRRPPLLPLPTNTKLPIPTPNNKNKRGRRALSSSSSSPPTHKKPLNLSPSSKSTVIAKTQNRLGPEPSDLPKQVCFKSEDEEDVGGLNSIFSLAPPPSSLPLPKFFLKSKLVSCNVEAVNWRGGMEDDGATATNDLRRLLRLC